MATKAGVLLKWLTCYSAGLEEPNAKRQPEGHREAGGVEAGGEAGGEAAAEAGAQVSEVDHTWRRVVSSPVSVASASSSVSPRAATSDDRPAADSDSD